MSPIVYLFVIVAIGIFVIAEVLIAYQKYQMKKEFIDEMDKAEDRDDKEPHNL